MPPYTRPPISTHLFLEGTAVVDTVTGDRGVVLGAASNLGQAHISVQVHRFRKDVVSDVRLSRLRAMPADAPPWSAQG